MEDVVAIGFDLSSTPLVAIAKKLNVSSTAVEAANALDKLGIHMQGSLQSVYLCKGGSIYAKSTIKPSAIHLLMQGMLGEASTEMLAEKFNQLVHECGVNYTKSVTLPELVVSTAGTEKGKASMVVIHKKVMPHGEVGDVHNMPVELEAIHVPKEGTIPKPKKIKTGSPKTSAFEDFEHLVVLSSQGKSNSIKGKSNLPKYSAAEFFDKVIKQTFEDVEEGAGVTGIPAGEKAKELVFENTEGIKKMAKTILRKATQLMQPVRGSGENSEYYVVALGKDYNVAVRIRKDYAVSLRVEGENLDPHYQKLAMAGLSKAGKTHWSAHFTGHDKATVSKSIGALLFAMEGPFEKMVYDVSPLVGKGA